MDLGSHKFVGYRACHGPRGDSSRGGVLQGVTVMFAWVCIHLRTDVSVGALACRRWCADTFAFSLTVVDAVGTVVGTVVGAFGNL